MDSEPPSEHLSFIPLVFPMLLAGNEFFAVLLLGFLLFCSAMVSGSEVAFFSMEPEDVKNLKSDESTRAVKAIELKERPNYLLATILILNNLINILIVLLSDFIVQRYFPQNLFDSWAQKVQENLSWLSSDPNTIARFLEFSVTVIGVTFILVLFGEVVPKIYARFNNVSMAKRMSPILSFNQKLFFPLSKFLVEGTNTLEKRLAKNNRPYNQNKEEINEAIELTVQGREDAEEEKDMLKRIIQFNSVHVKQIMTSRVDVVAVNIEDDLSTVLDVIKETGYSRIPVYEDNLDQIKGILYIKDLIGEINKEDFQWTRLVHKDTLFVPESKRINELLKEFQLKHLHMAIVVDEFGGCSGLITLEDIMEEVIGEITDEFDDHDDTSYKKLGPTHYIFEGKTQLTDIARIMDLPSDVFDDIKGESDTIAGLFLEESGEMPKLNEQIETSSFVLKARKVGKRRIQEIELVYKPQNDENED